MTSSLEVSLPDGVARIQDRHYAIRSLLRAEEEFRRGEMLPLSALDAVDAELEEELR